MARHQSSLWAVPQQYLNMQRHHLHHRAKRYASRQQPSYTAPRSSAFDTAASLFLGSPNDSLAYRQRTRWRRVDRDITCQSDRS